MYNIMFSLSIYTLKDIILYLHKYLNRLLKNTLCKIYINILYTITIMCWQRVANGRLQKVLPFRVYPIYQNIQKRPAIPTKDHLKYGFFMENYTEVNKNDNKEQPKNPK